MIIVVDGHMIGDHSGGNESYYRNILLSMRPDSTDQVYLLVMPGIDVSEFEDKFEILRFSSTMSFQRNFFELNRICKEINADVLHTQYFIPFVRSCKVVCTIHDICFEHYKNIFTKKEYMTQKILIPYAAKHSEFVFTVSEHAKADIMDHYGVDGSKVLVTHNAVNEQFSKLSRIDLNEKELRLKFGIGADPYILSVGNLQPRKNLPRLIEAFILWRRENQKGKLVIVGKKAWMYSEIMKAVAEDAENIILTDYISDKDLIRLYNAATCFIYPSFFEGFGIPPLEAMACGTPVAVANATSLPEVVGDAGLYFDPYNIAEIKDSINRLMTDRVLREELIKRSKTQVKGFDWSKSAGIIYEAYHRI